MLELQSAALSYANQVIFEHISFRLPAGKFLALLGPSGVGKTSLLRLIAGLHQTRPQAQSKISGQVLWNHQPVFEVAYMAQQDGLLPWLTVIDNLLLSFHLQNKTLPKEKAYHLLQQVKLENVAQVYPEALSGGMRQRVALIRTLLQDAPVVLMDEPFSALDALTRLEVQEVAAKLLREHHKTVVMVTHDPLEALRLADEIKVLSPMPVRLIDYPKPLQGDWKQSYEDLLSLLRSST